MPEKMFRRTEVLLILGALGLLLLSSVAVHARDPMSLHVLFTGSVSGKLEPSG
jgi:hypothetical protein